MIKVVWVARLRQDRPREEMRTYWTETHGREIGCRIEPMRSYVQSHVVGAIGAQGESDAQVAFDGYSVHEYDDRAAFEAALASQAFADVVEDGPNVFEMDSMDGMSAVVEERIMRDGPTSPFKVVWFAKFRPDVPRQVAADHWRDVHGPIALRAPGIDRYVQNLAVSAFDLGGVLDGELPAFDGFSECWYADREAYLRSQESPEWNELGADGATFLDMAALEGMSAILEERVIR
jgi:uncharacterized protein (TIGR02118 family)